MKNERQIAIDGMIQLGLSSGEAKTYVTLLELGISEATPLATSAGLPQPKIYGYLSKLERKGIITKAEISGKPNIFTPVTYDIVIDQLKKETENKISQTEQVLEKLQKEQKPLNLGEYIAFSQGQKAVDAGLREAVRKIKHNALIISSTQYDDQIEQLLVNRPDIVIKRPLTEINENIDQYPPFIMRLSNSPILNQLSQNRPMIIFRDVDEINKQCDSVIIIGHPADPTDLRQEPLIIEITHKIITSFQLRLVLTFVELLDNMKSLLVE